MQLDTFLSSSLSFDTQDQIEIHNTRTASKIQDLLKDIFTNETIPNNYANSAI